jgi:Ribosomal protein L11 methyltransferase (PrmA)
MVVQTGPFAGLRLHDLQTWGGGEDVGPQLLGIYEQELHSVLTNFVARRPTTVINIGCAEGYYAVGLARLLANARVFAFDIDPRAQKACHANAELNGVADRFIIDGPCSPECLREILTQDPNALIVVDCEGYEKALFADECTIAFLKCANIIIETHDFLDRGILPTLTSRFSASHRISIVNSGARNPNEFSFLDRCSDSDKWALVCENRPELQNWLVCERRSLPDFKVTDRAHKTSTLPSANGQALQAKPIKRDAILPLIYTVCFGAQEYFECLSLMLQSLYTFGEYEENFVLLTDRPEQQCRQNIPALLRDRVSIVKVASPNVTTRYLVREYLGVHDGPMLYVDTDIVVTKSVQPILNRISTGKGIYVCSEASLHHDINGVPASQLENQWANWFGLDLFKADLELCNRPLPCLNSGLFGFTSRSDFDEVSRQILDLYMDDKRPTLAKNYLDQPFFNYAVAKSKLVDTDLLSGSVAFVGRAQGAAEFARPFTHFLWARGADKRHEMAEFLETLKVIPTTIEHAKPAPALT